MRWIGSWCPEEDVELSKLSSKNRGLRGNQLSKVVPKAVPVEGQSTCYNRWTSKQ